MKDRLLEELQDFQLNDGAELDTNEQLKKETLENKKQDRELRKVFSYGLFIVVTIYLVIVLTFVYLCGFNLTKVSETVLVTLLGTTTANVIGLFVIVAKYSLVLTYSVAFYNFYAFSAPVLTHKPFFIGQQ